MNWWRGQNLDRPRKDIKGTAWHFQVWHGTFEGKYTQFIFFWNEAKSETGLVRFDSISALHISRLKQLMDRLVQQPAYRAQFHTDLKFPLERNYP